MSNKSGTGERVHFFYPQTIHIQYFLNTLLNYTAKKRRQGSFKLILFWGLIAISEFVPTHSFIHISDPFLNWQFDIPYWRESRPFPELILHSTELRLKGIWKKPSIALSKIFLKQVPSSNAVQWIYEITQSSGLLMEAWKCWICVVVYYKRLR